MHFPAIWGWEVWGSTLENFEILRPENAISCNLRWWRSGGLPQKILKFQGLKMQFPAIWGWIFNYERKGNKGDLRGKKENKGKKIISKKGDIKEIKEVPGCLIFYSTSHFPAPNSYLPAPNLCLPCSFLLIFSFLPSLLGTYYKLSTLYPCN